MRKTFLFSVSIAGADSAGSPLLRALRALWRFAAGQPEPRWHINYGSAVPYVEISFQLDEQRAYSRGLFAFTGRGT